MTSPTAHREVERKLRVTAEFALPDLVAAGIADACDPQQAFRLQAVYHDTADLTLFRWGITLRRREGGGDAGWHMKLPVAGIKGGARDELQVPLDAGAVGSVPVALLEIVAPLLRDQQVVAAVHVDTLRAPQVISDASGRALVELVDDSVVITRAGRVIDRFREIEVEALDADDPAALELLDRIVAYLEGHGATASSVSKAAQALGPRGAAAPDVPVHPMPGPDGLAVDALRAVLSQHVRHLLLADVAVRRDLPDSVHQMRVAARRIRSALAAFAPLLDSERSAVLREELKWMANELGMIRDTEVMKERLDVHAGMLDDPADTERARAAVDPLLSARLVAARSSALAALRSDRHLELVEDLVAAANRPPVSDAAYASCREVLLPLVSRTWRRLAKDIAALDLDSPSTEWHEARIRAKRARYTADAVAPIFGRRMSAYADAMADVTEVLGDHQDAYVAQGILRELSGHSDVDGATGFALGLLHEYEMDEEILDRVRFGDVWVNAAKAARKAGVTR